VGLGAGVGVRLEAPGADAAWIARPNSRAMAAAARGG
jgi:hypothetical protein